MALARQGYMKASTYHSRANLSGRDGRHRTQAVGRSIIARFRPSLAVMAQQPL